MLSLLLACTGLSIVPSPTVDDSGVPEHTGQDDSAVDDTGAADSAPDDSATDDSSADDSAVDDTGDTGEPGLTDLDVFQQALDGERSAADALLVVSHGGGWPIDMQDGSFIFAALDDGQTRMDLTGDFNSWAGQSMANASGLWWVQVNIAQPQGSIYKFHDGNEHQPDPWARAYGHDQYGEFSLVEGAGEHLERWHQLSGNGMAPRTVRVWVPLLATTHQLYVQDGQNLFDPTAIWGGWQLQEVLGDTTLAVGIDNTAARMDEYTQVADTLQGTAMGGQADDYADFVLQVVRPLVEQEYGQPTRTGVMGSSLGGLVAMHMGLRHTNDYDFVASLSGTLGWGSIEQSNPTVIEAYDEAGFNGLFVYLDSGGGPGTGCVDSDGDGVQDDSAEARDNYCETRQMADLLAADGWTWDQNLWHWWEPDAPHNEAAWAARVERPVQLFEGL